MQLLPQREIPTPWTKPEVYRSGLRVNLLPHWNPELCVKIADSFRSERFQQLHLGALRNLESVELQVDDWTLDLVRRYAGSIKSYKDADRRVADENLIARDLKTAERVSFHPNINTATLVLAFGDFERFLTSRGNPVRYLVV